MAQLVLSNMRERESGNAYVRLFRAVLAEAVRDDDALEWLASADGALVCDLADVERDAVRLALERGDVPKRRIRQRREAQG
ncbi:MAG: hypothetical protein V2J51_03595 [Erythrobacter sp.]|jgi:hypothetical protein|nr:hypothetical protein [Erythrobacter sp.]